MLTLRHNPSRAPTRSNVGSVRTATRVGDGSRPVVRAVLGYAPGHKIKDWGTRTDCDRGVAGVAGWPSLRVTTHPGVCVRTAHYSYCERFNGIIKYWNGSVVVPRSAASAGPPSRAKE
jgi:hypothetical protein